MLAFYAFIFLTVSELFPCETLLVENYMAQYHQDVEQDKKVKGKQWKGYHN